MSRTHNYNFQFESTYLLEADYSLTLPDGSRTRISVRYAAPDYDDKLWNLSSEEFEREIVGATDIVRWSYKYNKEPIPLEVFCAFIEWLKQTARFSTENENFARGFYHPERGWIKV